jgi:hypothetical protein
MRFDSQGRLLSPSGEPAVFEPIQVELSDEGPDSDSETAAEGDELRG